MGPESVHAQTVAHITLDDTPREVPAGPTVVSKLKSELEVDATFVLYLLHGHEKRMLADTDTVDVESGQHFEALPGGGVS